MSASLIVTLLAQRDTAELEGLRESMRADVARMQVELEQVEEALGRQARRGTRSGPGSRGTSTRNRVVEILRAADDPMSPVEIIAALKEQGPAPSRGAVYTLLGRLRDSQDVERVDNRYRLPSRNGDDVAAFPGLSENGSGEPLSPATRTQEGDQQ